MTADPDLSLARHLRRVARPPPRPDQEARPRRHPDHRPVCNHRRGRFLGGGPAVRRGAGTGRRQRPDGASAVNSLRNRTLTQAAPPASPPPGRPWLAHEFWFVWESAARVVGWVRLKAFEGGTRGPSSRARTPTLFPVPLNRPDPERQGPARKPDEPLIAGAESIAKRFRYF